ncbi:hypothetical protein [uncultured Nocardioides sp.]|uniref:hypothetical protein n=1 Tax=uncultured Nocardioides sp. TaxID=198441 RepID=UPI00262C2680|nr:hypothetical protein [uncultured Nocardioides sp.]
MSDRPNSNPVRGAASRLNAMYSHGRTPDPADVAQGYRELGYARIQREIRRSQGNVPQLDPVHVGHLVAMLVSGVDAEAVERFERAVREAVYELPLSNADRARIAALITGGAA